MTRAARWLAAVAGLALVAGVPATADAAARTRVVPHAKAKPKKVSARARPVARKTRTAQIVREADPSTASVIRRPARAGTAILTPPPGYVAPPREPIAVPAPSYADYRWLDDAGAMLDTIGRSPPDSRFEEVGGGAVRDAWVLGDGSLIIADRVSEFDTRLFFFAPDTTVPFLVQDRYFSYGFDRASLAVVYDEGGRLDAIRPDDWRIRAAGELYARGRQLWYALRTRPAVRTAPPVSVFLNVDTRPRWRENDAWRAYRGGVGYDHGRERDGRYRRERDDRAGRGAPVYGGNATGGWSGGRPASGYTPARPIVERASRPGRARPAPGEPAIVQPSGEAPFVAAPVALAPMPAVLPGQPGAIERASTEPTGERPTRRSFRPGAEAPVASAPAPERMAEPERLAPPMPEPAVIAPSVEEAAPREAPMAREPEVAGPPPRAEPAPPPPPPPAVEPPLPPPTAQPPAAEPEPKPAPRQHDGELPQ